MDIIRFYLKCGLFLFVTIFLAPFYFLILFILFRWRLSVGPRLVRFYSSLCLMIFSVRVVRTRNHDIFRGIRKGILIISNHQSFLDIFLLSALFGSVFVSKAEVRNYPVIGQIAWLMGVIFLKRDSSSERLRVLNTIAESCSNQILAVFPQGTTGGTNERLPFNRGIFKVAELNPGVSLLPVTIHYKDDAEIAWNKPQSLMANAKKVCAKKRIDVRVIIHEPFTADDFREKTAAQICQTVQDMVLDPLNEKFR